MDSSNAVGNRKLELEAYCAGLFDGEGSFSFIKQNKEGQHKKHGRISPVYYGVIRIGMVCSEALELISETFPGSTVKREAIRKNKPNYQVMYRWEMRKRDLLIPMLSRLIPFLIVKRKQAEMLLEALKGWKQPLNRKLGMDPEELERREKAYIKMGDLNAVGSKARLRQQTLEMIEPLAQASSEEIWKAIPGFEGVYAASNQGIIKQIASGRLQERIIKPHFHGSRDALVHLKKDENDHALNLKELIMGLFTKDVLDLPIGFRNRGNRNFAACNLYYITELVIDGFEGEHRPNEEWKTCLSYPELMVSNFGRIYAKSTHFKGTNGLGEPIWKIKKGRIRKLDERCHSLVHVKNKRLGINKQLRVDLLVLEAFVGSSNAEISHKNGIKNDNNLNNLEYTY